MKIRKVNLRITLILFAAVIILFIFDILLFTGRISFLKRNVHEENSSQQRVLRAISLLPDPSEITQVQEVHGTIFWILRETKDPTMGGDVGGWGRFNHYESWIVNTQEGTAYLAQDRVFFEEFEVSTHRSVGKSVFEVHHSYPDSIERVDYYDAVTGNLILSTDWSHYLSVEKGNTIDVAKDGKTIQIYLAPPIDFPSEVKERKSCESYKVTVDALLVNEQRLEFDKNHRVEYRPFALHRADEGECGWVYPNFTKPALDMFEGRQGIYFNLPWNERVGVDINNLDISGVFISAREVDE